MQRVPRPRDKRQHSRCRCKRIRPPSSRTARDTARVVVRSAARLPGTDSSCECRSQARSLRLSRIRRRSGSRRRGLVPRATNARERLRNRWPRNPVAQRSSSSGAGSFITGTKHSLFCSVSRSTTASFRQQASSRRARRCTALSRAARVPVLLRGYYKSCAWKGGQARPLFASARAKARYFPPIRQNSIGAGFSCGLL